MKLFILTYCQSFLLISCGLHNPPGWSPRSSWQADEITVSEGEAYECLISRHVQCRPTTTGHCGWGNNSAVVLVCLGLFVLFWCFFGRGRGVINLVLDNLFLSGDEVPVVHQPRFQLLWDFHLHLHTVGEHLLLDNKNKNIVLVVF